MMKTYPTPTKTQAQHSVESHIFGDAVVKSFNKDLNSKHYHQKNKIAICDQHTRIVEIEEYDRKDWKLYCLQIFYYLHVGVGNTREWGQEYIREWLASSFGLQICPRSLYDYNEILKRQGRLKIKPTKYLNSVGKRVRGHNEYTLIKVDPYVHFWQGDRPFLSIGKKFANTLNNNLTVIRITNTTTDSLENISVPEKPKPKYRPKSPPKDPNRMIEPKEWDPQGKTLAFLTAQVGNRYLAQYEYIEEYQRWWQIKTPGLVRAGDMSHLFFLKLPEMIAGREEFGDKYVPIDKRLAWKLKASNEADNEEIEENEMIQKGVQEKEKKATKKEKPYVSYAIVHPSPCVRNFREETDEETEDALADFYRRNGTTPPKEKLE